MSTRDHDLQGFAPAQARHPAALGHTPRDFSNPAATYSRPEATTATAAAGRPPRHPEPNATAPGGGEKTPPTRAQGCGTAALAQPLRRVTRSHCRRRGLRLALLRPSPKRAFLMSALLRSYNWNGQAPRNLPRATADSFPADSNSCNNDQSLSSQ